MLKTLLQKVWNGFILVLNRLLDFLVSLCVLLGFTAVDFLLGVFKFSLRLFIISLCSIVSEKLQDKLLDYCTEVEDKTDGLL